MEDTVVPEGYCDKPLKCKAHRLSEMLNLPNMNTNAYKTYNVHFTSVTAISLDFVNNLKMSFMSSSEFCWLTRK